MTAWQSGFVARKGIRLHYTRTGGNRSPVVLAHGFSDDGLCWTPVARALEAEYDLVMVDARGHGRSDAPAQGYDATTMAGDLAQVIDGLGLQRPIILGHSMGARMAMVLAGEFPGLPRAIALEDPPAWWDTGPEAVAQAAARMDQNRIWIAGLQQQSREAIIAAQRAAAPQWSDDELGPWADSKLRFNPNYFNRGDSPELAPEQLLARVRCPALLITADPALGAIVTEEQAAALRALVPQMRREHVADAGHSIRRDQPQAYLRIIWPQFAVWTAAA